MARLNSCGSVRSPATNSIPHSRMDVSYALLLAAAVHYVSAPLMTRATSKSKAAIKPVEIGPQDFPAKLAVFFETQARALEQMGFHRTAYMRMPESVTGAGRRIDSYVVTMLNRVTGDAAS